MPGCGRTTNTSGADKMKKWNKPVFEEFDVNGEVTAYAGAERGEVRPRETADGGRRGASAPASGADRTGSPSRRAN